MSNLIPTIITDRNGKITTVHRRDDVSRSSSSTLPAPALPKSTLQRDECIAAIMVIANKELLAPGRGVTVESVKKVERKLGQYSDDTLASLRAALQGNQNIHRSLSVMLERNLSETIVHEAASLLPEVAYGHPTSTRESLLSLREYDDLPKSDNYALADEELRKKCIALISVSTALDGVCDVMSGSPILWGGPEMSPIIQDKALVRLVLDNPEKAPLIAKFIEERLSVDYEAIQELVSSGSSSLSEGTL